MRFIIKGLFFLVEPRAQNLAVLCCSRVTPVSLQNSELNDYLSSWVQSWRKIWKLGGKNILTRSFYQTDFAYNLSEIKFSRLGSETSETSSAIYRATKLQEQSWKVVSIFFVPKWWLKHKNGFRTTIKA